MVQRESTMRGIKKILFPVDFSQRSIGAARYVESFAGWFDAEIMLLHIVDVAIHGSMDSIVKDWLWSTEEQLNAFLTQELKHFTTRRVFRIGDPTEEIVKMVHCWTPDLVMMPSYGIGSYRPCVLGSVTAKVLHDIDCPVWTAVHADNAPALEKITLSKVLCAVDLGPRSGRVLQWAASFASQREAELGLVHAVPIVEPPRGQTPDQGLADLLVAEGKAQLNALQETAGVKAAFFVNPGEPFKVVACAAKSFAGDLVIIGRHTGSGDDGHLRHNAYAIIRDSPCPVISI